MARISGFSTSDYFVLSHQNIVFTCRLFFNKPLWSAALANFRLFKTSQSHLVIVTDVVCNHS